MNLIELQRALRQLRLGGVLTPSEDLRLSLSEDKVGIVPRLGVSARNQAAPGAIGSHGVDRFDLVSGRRRTDPV